MMDKSKSDSREQQNAECYIATEAENILGCRFECNPKVIIGEAAYEYSKILGAESGHSF